MSQQESSSSSSNESATNNLNHLSRMNITYQNVQMVDIDSISRPVFPELDLCKVDSLMNTIETDYDKVPPLEALRSPSGKLYVFGGCHRYEAHRRLGKNQIKLNIRDATPMMLQMYLGASYLVEEENYKKQLQEKQQEQV